MKKHILVVDDELILFALAKTLKNDAKEHYLKNAISAVGSGAPVKTNSTKSVGCSIKRVE